MKLGLENIMTLLTALDSPESKYLKVQVAGTNGKGSVCAFLDSICVSAGIKTGAFTSPHLISITERVRIDGIDITEVEFARHATVVRQTAEILLGSGELEYLPTFFEQITAIALFAFAEAKCEVAILETGLGGRLDATTAANAEIAAITQIDFDHQEYLGQTLSEIASEKAAIIHAESAVVVGGQNHEAGNLIRKRIADLGLEASLSDDVSVFSDGQTVRFQTKRDIYEVARLGLTGRHQLENAKVA
ncbi:MAG TPA: Mur ligase family protein, partial [Pyrinomonadaceae bacterium]|nr:Mur ligase family protein [Pyrinomonadaceae bacterium]